MKKKFLQLLTLTLAVLLLLTSCANTSDPEDSSAESSGAEETVDPNLDKEIEGKLTLFLNKQVRVSLVYPERGLGTPREGATRLYQRFYTFFQTKVEMKDDFLMAGQSHDPNSVEILIGHTNYQESKDVLATLDYGDYAVKVVGNKIVATGLTDQGIEKACDILYDYITRNITKNRSLFIAKDFYQTGTILEAANQIPKMDGLTNISVCDTGDDCISLTAKDTDYSLYTAYATMLQNNGYTLYDSHDILTDQNKYSQYTNDQYSLTLLYTTHNKYMQILFEPLSQISLLPKEAGSYTTANGYVPKMWQVGVTDPIGTNDSVYNGMCYIYQLADGSYVIYDGGFDDVAFTEGNRQNARRIYEILKEHAFDPNNITIAAWVPTHAHIDHIGALIGFEKLGFTDTVKIEAVICNIPGDAQYATESNDAEMDGKIDDYRVTLDAMQKKGTKIYKAHPGQIFYLRNAVIEILYTHDLRATETMSGFNNTSIVSRITLYQENGEKANSVMMTGDTYGESTNVMIKMYGSALKTDFLQISHHGHSNNVTDTWFAYVAPSYALWPISQSKDANDDKGYNQVSKNGKNVWIWNNIPNQIYWAFWQTYEFTLPFDGTEATYTRTDNVTYPALTT